MQGRPGFAWEGGGKHAAWALPPAAAGAWGITGDFTCLSPHPSLPGWLASSGLWAVRCCGLRPAVPTYLALKMQQGHKPRPCCQCPRCPIAPGHTVTVFAAFSALLPWHELCGSSGSHPCLCTTGGLHCTGDVGNSCWEGPIFCSSTRRAWGGLPYLALLCKASPAVLAALP